MDQKKLLKKLGLLVLKYGWAKVAADLNEHDTQALKRWVKHSSIPLYKTSTIQNYLRRSK